MSNLELEAKHPGYKFRWWIVAVVLAAEIVDLLDATIVNIAGPTLRASLGSSVTQLQWVIGGYTLALGAGLVVGGRLGDRFGTRQMFLLGMVGFTLASLLCAISPSIELLITFRIVQGFLGAMLLPQGFGLIRGAFPPQEFGKAFAAYGPAFGIAGILGPILGGAIIQGNWFNLDWRVVFLVNLPIGLVAAIMAWRVLPKTKPNKQIRIDLLGAGVVAVASALLVWPLIQGQDAGWPLWTWVSMAVSLALFYIFVLLERRSVAHGETPLVEPSLFKKPAFTFGLAGIALYFGALVGFNLLLTLFFQLGHGFSTGEAGLANIPLTLGTAVGGGVAGAVLSAKLGRVTLQLGAALSLVGLLLVWLVAAASFNYWLFVPGFAIFGIGSGFVVSSLFDIILSATDDHESGSASGALTAIQSIASSMGVAITAAVFFKGFSAADLAQFHFTEIKAQAAMQAAILVPAIFLALFLLVSPKLPRFASRH